MLSGFPPETETVPGVRVCGPHHPGGAGGTSQRPGRGGGQETRLSGHKIKKI